MTKTGLVKASHYAALGAMCLLVIPLSSCFSRAGASRTLLPLDVGKVTRIEIASPRLGYPITLERMGAAWFLSIGGTVRFPANEKSVALALSALADSRAVYAVQGNPGSYGIDRSISTTVTVRDPSGRVLIEVAEGNASVTGGFRYYLDVRSSTVIRSVPLDALTETRTAYWANLSPFRDILEGREIERIRYRAGNEVSRVVTRWEGIDGETEIDRFSKALVSLNCVDVTNIPVIANEFIDIWLSDLTLITLKIARLDGGHAAIGASAAEGMWILSTSALDGLADGP